MLTAPATAQVTWEGFVARSGSAVAYDSQLNRMVMFGGTSVGNTTLGDTWNRGGTASWEQVNPGTSPPPSSGHAMSGSPSGSGVILFGGIQSGSASNLTWRFDGNNWSQQTSPASPSPRTGHALCKDPIRGVVVLFGGQDNTGLLDDTWEWNGTTWSQRFPTTSPPPQARHGMAFGTGPNKVTLVSTSEQCWQYDGVTWTQGVNFPGFSGAGANFGFSLTTAPVVGGVLLWGGQEPPFVHSGMARFDGTSWTMLTQTNRPPPRGFHYGAYDETRDVMVIHGGSADGFTNRPVYSDTWEWDGLNWSQRLEDRAPARRTDTNMAYDDARGEIVLFGGHIGPDSIPPSSDTWVRSGRIWNELNPGTFVRGRGGHAMAFDSNRDVVVMFGGCEVPSGSGCGCCDSSYVGNGTYEWDGSNWNQRSPATAPLHRAFAGMTFDPVRNVTVLFGGASNYFMPGHTILGDTWEWNGTNWTQRSTPTAPPARLAPGFAYMPGQNQAILFGGRSTSGSGLRDTWAWNGNSWTQLTPATVPPAMPSSRINNPMTYDPVRQRLVLAWAGNVWEWLGTDWLQRVPVAPGGGGPVTFDATLAKVVSHDGTTWEYGPVYPATTEQRGTGCPGPLGPPSLVPLTLPWIGSTQSFQLVNVPLPAGSFCTLGFDDQAWLGTPLPWDMTPIGMPGCQLRVAPAATEFVVGTAWNFGIPNAPSLLGLPFFTQAMVIDPPANAVGFTVTQSVAGVMGTP
ncbi:MAG: hypothetical protein KDC98_14095 [Planctomycetes bacterium]|nr:hypothetical protein [Planctomycetota bacterium]